MSTGLVTITKSMDGQEWSNTYGISVGSDDGALTLADLEGIVATNPSAGLTPATTYVDDPAWAGATSIIAALIGFERVLHYSPVTFTRVNISDGATPGTPTGTFWSQNLNLTGMRDNGGPVAADAVAPLNVAFLVNRNPAALSIKPGRLYYRACLLDLQVRPGSRVGVTWRADTDASAMVAYLALAVSSADLGAYMASPVTTLPTIYLSIPHISQGIGTEGQVTSGSPVSSFSVNKPVSRQLTRGRRRRVGV